MSILTSEAPLFVLMLSLNVSINRFLDMLMSLTDPTATLSAPASPSPTLSHGFISLRFRSVTGSRSDVCGSHMVSSRKQQHGFYHNVAVGAGRVQWGKVTAVFTFLVGTLFHQ